MITYAQEEATVLSNPPAIKSLIQQTENSSGKITELSTAPIHLEELLELQYRDGIDVPQRSSRNEVLERRLLVLLNDNKQIDASKLLQTDLDVAVLFDRRSAVSPNITFQLLQFMSVDNPKFFLTAIQRMAFVAGFAWTTRFELAWTTRFQSYFSPSQDSIAQSCATGRKTIEHAASFFERTSKAALETSSELPSVFQLACAARSYEVVSYLLRVGLGPNSFPAYAHPIIQSFQQKDVVLEQILRDRLYIPRDIYTRALWSLFTPRVVHRVFWYSDSTTAPDLTHSPCLLPALQAARIFIKNGADTQSVVKYNGKTIPFIHAVIYALHDADITPDYRLQMFTVFVQEGKPDLNVVSEAIGTNIRISVLALAVSLGELQMLEVLLDHGAKLFWPRYSSLFEILSAKACSSRFEDIVNLVSTYELLWPDTSMEHRPRNPKRVKAPSPHLSDENSTFAPLRRQYAYGVDDAVAGSKKHLHTKHSRPMLDGEMQDTTCSNLEVQHKMNLPRSQQVNFAFLIFISILR
jgi:hypothetical protein